MAHSDSIRKGQQVLTCQLCEESSKIQCKCLQCNFLLCSKCKKLHEKVKSADPHTIIDIKDISKHVQDSAPGLDLGSIPCNVHRGQKCCLFCQTCEEVICPICIPKTHNTHEMVELNKGYNLSLEKIKYYNSKLQNDLDEQANELSTLESLQQEQSEKYKHEKKQILNQDSVLKDAVNKCTNKFINELDQHWKTLHLEMNKEKSKAGKERDDWKSMKQRLDAIILSGQEKEIFDALKEVKTLNQQQKNQVNIKFQRLPTFEQKSDNIADIESLHGSFNETTEDEIALKKEPNVLQVYRTSQGLVENILICDGGSLWISYRYNNHGDLCMLTMKKDSILYEKVFQQAVFNMALLPSGDLLLSTRESSLYTISKDTGAINKSIFNVAPLVTLGVHVTKDQKIIVSTRNPGLAGNIPYKGPKQVILMTMKGKTEKIYQLDHQKRELFCSPIRLTSDQENIYVMDLLNNDGSGRIVAIKRSSAEKMWTYQGPKIKDYNFTPRDILVTQLNNIIVSDHHNSLIHILNNTGKCVKVIAISEMNIKYPYSLDIDSKGHLYIGCDAIKPDVAKIYVIDFARF